MYAAKIKQPAKPNERLSMANQSAQTGLQLPAVNSLPNATVQRTVLFDDTRLDLMRDTSRVITNFETYADTYARLNDVELPGAHLGPAVNGPVIAINQEEERVRLTVIEEAQNEVSSRVELPAPPPWIQAGVDSNRLSVCLATMEGENLPIGHEQPKGMQPGESTALLPDPAEPVTLRAFGFPNDAAFAKGVEDHELHHVDDVYRTFRNRLQPWDENIHRFKMNTDSVVAANAEQARTIFYHRMGGTPGIIGDEIENSLREQGLAFHELPEGGKPRYEDISTVRMGMGMPMTVTVTLRHSH